MKDGHNIDLLPEIKLIQEARAGNKESFCKLYGLYKDKLYRYALYRLGNPADAEDAVSECVLAAWKGIRSLKSDGAFSSWIFRILHNICAGMLRKEISSREGLETAGNELDTAGQANVQNSVEIAEALATLKDDEREIVLLSVVSGLTSKEISEATGLTSGAVRSKLSRSLTKLRAVLS